MCFLQCRHPRSATPCATDYATCRHPQLPSCAGSAVKALLVMVHGWSWHSLYFSDFGTAAAAQVGRPPWCGLPSPPLDGRGFRLSSSHLTTLPPRLPAWRHPRMQGVEVVSFDLQGHGRSESLHGMRGYARRMSDHCADVAAVLAAARERRPGVPAVLLGESLGGTIVLRLLQLRPELQEQVGGAGQPGVQSLPLLARVRQPRRHARGQPTRPCTWGVRLCRSVAAMLQSRVPATPLLCSWQGWCCWGPWCGCRQPCCPPHPCCGSCACWPASSQREQLPQRCHAGCVGRSPAVLGTCRAAQELAGSRSAAAPREA
jgi:hypothetical protein